MDTKNNRERKKSFESVLISQKLNYLRLASQSTSNNKINRKNGKEQERMLVVTRPTSVRQPMTTNRT